MLKKMHVFIFEMWRNSKSSLTEDFKNLWLIYITQIFIWKGHTNLNTPAAADFFKNAWPFVTARH